MCQRVVLVSVCNCKAVLPVAVVRVRWGSEVNGLHWMMQRWKMITLHLICPTLVFTALKLFSLFCFSEKMSDAARPASGLTTSAPPPLLSMSGWVTFFSMLLSVFSRPGIHCDFLIIIRNGRNELHGINRVFQ